MHLKPPSMFANGPLIMFLRLTSVQTFIWVSKVIQIPSIAFRQFHHSTNQYFSIPVKQSMTFCHKWSPICSTKLVMLSHALQCFIKSILFLTIPWFNLCVWILYTTPLVATPLFLQSTSWLWSRTGFTPWDCRVKLAQAAVSPFNTFESMQIEIQEGREVFK